MGFAACARESPGFFPAHLPTVRSLSMHRSLSAWSFYPTLLALIALVSLAGSARAADEYAYDGVHSSVSFKARHLDISWIHGRFNEASGKFVIDRQDPSKSTFEFSVKADSVDTGN